MKGIRPFQTVGCLRIPPNTAYLAFVKIIPNQLYHVYNQGNNQQPVFFTDENYLYFLRLLRKFVSPHCDLLAYCLMPNHFHFLVNTTENSCVLKKSGVVEMNTLAFGFKTLLSSYAQAINKQQKQTGSLFRQATKADQVDEPGADYSLTAFHYIHQNPLKAKLVSRPEDWAYSSFADYAGFRKGTLCNQDLAYELLPLVKESFYTDSLNRIDDRGIKF